MRECLRRAVDIYISITCKGGLFVMRLEMLHVELLMNFDMPS